MSSRNFGGIVHRPTQGFIESTNIWSFMREYDIDTYDGLIEATCLSAAESDFGREWFWDELVSYLGIEFDEPYRAVREDSNGPQFTRWYVDGKLNIARNVVERHANCGNSANATATIWEGEDGTVKTQSFASLDRESNQVANVLESLAIEPGDTVALYMPMVPEIVPILYGCFKVGAIAVPIFSGFGEDAVATRLDDAQPSVLFTADGFYRRGSTIPLKPTADTAIERTGSVNDVIVIERLGDASTSEVSISDYDRDLAWTESVGEASTSYDARGFPSDHESMLLYSSGTTGRPKGIVQTHAGVQVQCPKEIYFGFDLQPDDRFFWLSDIGWMMGPWMLIGVHTFGETVVLYEGAPDHPEPDRLWKLVDRHRITQFGISPTAIRSLRRRGDSWVEHADLSSLRILGSTGEPWDRESWEWFYEAVGNSELPIINISGGTEICGCFLMPMPIQDLKPCTLGGPGLGMAVDIVDEQGSSVTEAAEQGYLVARDSCPSMTKSLWSGDDRYIEEYWSTWPDLWDHGDWALRDSDGFWFLLGRADDTLNVAGRKVGPAEVEGALIEQPSVNQAVAIGVPDSTTGTAVVCFVMVVPGQSEDESLRTSLADAVAESLGKPFRPSEIHFVDDFPKTQSGKIIRRAVSAAHRGEDPGDLSSIENPSALDDIRSAQ